MKNKPECPHCKFLSDTFLDHPDSNNREYWLMTEVFLYLHGGDVCDYSKNPNIKTLSRWEYMIRPLAYKVEDLNKLGQDGWEMCGIEYFEKHDSETFYFKRRLKS